MRRKHDDQVCRIELGYLKLNDSQKLDRLYGLAAVCELEYKKDWSWHVEREEEFDLTVFDSIFLKMFPNYKF